MATPHVAAVLAARTSLEAFPTEDGPCVIQAIGRDALLSCCVTHVDVALDLARLLAPLVATQGLILVADAYHETVDVPDGQAPPELPPRGELGARFRQGDPAVTEALLVHSAWRDAPAQQTILPYVRTSSAKGPGIQWLAQVGADYDSGGGSGRVPEALAEALAARQRPVPHGWEVEAMGVLAEQLGRAGIICDVLELPDTIDLRP